MADKKSGHYKLTYLDWPGLAEVSRMLFAIAKVPFEDARITMDAYFPGLSPEWKAKFPWGQVPTLEVCDGDDTFVLAQSIAINRFLGVRFGLAGDNEWEAAKCDEYVDAFKDYFTEYFNYVHEPDKVKKADIMKNIMEVSTPKYLGRFNMLIEGGFAGHLVGTKLSWADVHIGEMLTYIEQLFQIQIVHEYPALEALRKKLYELPEIEAWFSSRPQINPEGLTKMQARFSK